MASRKEGSAAAASTVVSGKAKGKSGPGDSAVKQVQIDGNNHLSKTLQLLMDRVDEMSQDIVKYNT
uniref:eIF3h C-terminal domain-containing protein n=1 Tax=Ailuropoda melanoleuca TaxID=9646 RepID=A0A7N5JT15_AILME